MASLREEARWFLDEARDGIAWIAVWKTGRAWHCEKIDGLEYEVGDWLKHRNSSFGVERWCKPGEVLTKLEAIFKADSNAILVNGYYTNLGDPDYMTLQSLVEALRWQYESSGNLHTALEDIRKMIKKGSEEKVTDTEGLKKAIEDSGLKMNFICDHIGITYATLRRKINNETEFTASEIMAMALLLNLSDQQRTNIFFKQ